MWRKIQPQGQAQAPQPQPQRQEEVQVPVQGAHELRARVPPVRQAEAAHYDARQH